MHLILFLVCIINFLTGKNCKENLAFLSTPELLTFWGYETENHTIITKDEYILTLHRIPNYKSKYYPVIVQHGILMASDSWVLRGPKDDLVLQLADEGFDIWLANTRGNYYSKNHASYSTLQKQFWDFGWNELGLYDIPAMIKHIQQVTGQPKVIHIGHSMGTTSFYAMLCKKPEMNKKIHAHISLAPVAYMHHMKSLKVLRPVLNMMQQLLQIQNNLKLYDIFGRSRQMSEMTMRMCGSSRNTKRLCYRLMFYLIGSDFKQLDENCFDRYIGHFPSGASSTMFVHFFQNAFAKEFREFDYGPAINIQKYGNSIPPLYNISEIIAPIYLYYSTNDYLSHHLDVEAFASQLPNLKKKYLVPFKYFNHMDYIWAIDSKKLLFDDILKTMKTFSLRPYS